jgi:hypothetical protein
MIFVPGANVVFLFFLIPIAVARSFGKGAGFGLGLGLLGPIFSLILGFGNAQYVGAPGGTGLRRAA